MKTTLYVCLYHIRGPPANNYLMGNRGGHFHALPCSLKTGELTLSGMGAGACIS